MRIILFLIQIIPVFYVSYELFVLQEVNDPIKYIYTFTGVMATVLLFISITLSIPLVKKRIKLLKYRRQIGLFGFFYAFLHLLNFVVLDARMDFAFVVKESLDKPFIYLGMIAFFLLLFMTITSTKKLFAKAHKYHRVIYIVLALVTIHFVMAQKSLNIPQWGYLGIILIIAVLKFKQKVLKRSL